MKTVTVTVTQPRGPRSTALLSGKLYLLIKSNRNIAQPQYICYNLFAMPYATPRSMLKSQN